MNLFRLTYIRDKRPASITFAAVDCADAAEFSTLWESVTKLPVLTMTPLPPSKIPTPPWRERRFT